MVGDFYEKYLRFGLVLGWLAILKKNGGRLLATFDSGFFMFSGAKRKFNFSLSIAMSALKSCIK